MKEVRVEDAVGMVLGHDLTRIVPGQFKGIAFRKGHIIREEDVPELLRIGKQHIFIMEIEQGMLHENDAAFRLAQVLLHESLTATDPAEGKINLKAKHAGLLKINEDALLQMNMIGDLVVVTKHPNRPVKEGDVVAGFRAIPLVIEEKQVNKAVDVARQCSPVVSVLPYHPHRVGVVTTGGEVHSGLIEDKFGPVIREKVAPFGSEVVKQIIVADEVGKIQAAMREVLELGVDMLIITGGMSVDPDDRTPGAIRQMGADIVSYGMPILPGSMTLFAYLEGIPLFGLPGCVIYDPFTAFDVLLPRVLAGDLITRSELAAMGAGGLMAVHHHH